jgi:hypothetical protein
MPEKKRTIRHKEALIFIALMISYGCGPNRKDQANPSSNAGANSSIAFDRQGLYNGLLGPELKQAIVDSFVDPKIKGIGLIWHRENLYVLAVDTGQNHDNGKRTKVVYFAASVLSDNDNKPYWDVQLIATDAEELIKLIGSLDKSTKESSTD